jgi:hypothetical protein
VYKGPVRLDDDAPSRRSEPVPASEISSGPQDRLETAQQSFDVGAETPAASREELDAAAATESQVDAAGTVEQNQIGVGTFEQDLKRSATVEDTREAERIATRPQQRLDTEQALQTDQRIGDQGRVDAARRELETPSARVDRPRTSGRTRDPPRVPGFPFPEGDPETLGDGGGVDIDDDVFGSGIASGEELVDQFFGGGGQDR